MKIAYRLFRSSLPLFILLLLVLNLAPSRLVLAGPLAPQTVDPSMKIYLPIMGKGELPIWLGPDGGSAIFITADPYNSAVFYAGSNGAGIFKSTDGGASWRPASQGLGNATIYCLAIDPTNTNVIYAGTYGDGVYKTNDGAGNWFQVSSGIGLPAVVYSLAVNPDSPNIVYASTRGQNSLDGVLYRSTNNGAGWEAVFNQANDWVYSLAVNPNAPDIVLAATHEHGPYIAGSYGSRDSWQPAEIDSGEWFKGRAVAVDPRSWERHAYFSAWHGDFYRSSNNGQSWVEYNSGLGTSHVYPNGIVIKPSDPDTVYMAAHSSDVAGVLKSNNAGASWSGAGLYGSTVYTVAASAYGDTVLAGTYLDGIYRSTNGGASWSHSLTGFSNTQVSGVAIYNGRMIAATLGGGLQQSLDGGYSWSPFNSGLSDQYINALVQNPGSPNILFALASNAGLYRIDLSSGGGWKPAAAALVSSPAVAPADAGESAATAEADQLPPRQTSPLVRREPLDEFLELEGETEMPALQPQELTTAAVGGTPLVLVFAPSNPSFVYLGTSQGLYASGDGGSTWTQRLSGYQVNSITVSPKDPARVYAAVNNQAGLIKTSADAGQTWTDLNAYNMIIHALAATRGGPDLLYVATDYGVIRYDGTSWLWANGLNTKISVLAPSPSRPGQVYIGTDQGAYVVGDGLYVQTIAAGFGVQAFSFDPADPYHVYTGTVARGTLRFRVN